MRIALISVSNKEGVGTFGNDLLTLDFKILASGGTADRLRKENVPVTDIAEYIGGKAILGHKVVSLSREIYAGLLASMPEDEAEMAALALPFIDLVCVDMYPMEQEIAKPGATIDSVRKQTDIGGPSMLRAGAKGNRIVISDAKDRQKVINWLKAGEPGRDEFINDLAAKAEATVAKYSLASSRFRSNGGYDGIVGERVYTCCYGENRYQSPAALYSTGTDDPLALHEFKRIEGSEPSYINLTDIDRLLQTMTHIAATFEVNQGKVPSIAVGCKHGNSCGAGVAGTCGHAIHKMTSGDPLALFGGMVMTNFPLTGEMAEIMLTAGGKRVLDGVIAPSFSSQAVEILRRKNDRCRLYENQALGKLTRDSLDKTPILRRVRGGFLLQPNYGFVFDAQDKQLEKSGDVDKDILSDIILAWATGATSNSNTITIVKEGTLIGRGIGQQDRVGCCNIAITYGQRARHDLNGAVAYSDSFFPFPDGPEVLAKAGIKTIFTTSGSQNDKLVREKCRDYGVTLWMIPDAIGRGFFGH